MGLLDELTPAKAVTACKIRTIESELAEADSKIFTAAIVGVEIWKAEPLSKALKQRGISVSPGTIKLHRQGACSCSKI